MASRNDGRPASGTSLRPKQKWHQQHEIHLRRVSTALVAKGRSFEPHPPTLIGSQKLFLQCHDLMLKSWLVPLQVMRVPPQRGRSRLDRSHLGLKQLWAYAPTCRARRGWPEPLMHWPELMSTPGGRVGTGWLGLVSRGVGYCPLELCSSHDDIHVARGAPRGRSVSAKPDQRGEQTD